MVSTNDSFETFFWVRQHELTSQENLKMFFDHALMDRHTLCTQCLQIPL